MRTKSVFIFLALVTVLVAAVVFRVDQLLFADKLGTSEAQNRAQVGAVAESVQSELKLFRETLAMNWNRLQTEKKEDHTQNFAPKMLMVASLKRAASGEWNLESPVYFQGTQVKSWATHYSILALKQLDQKLIESGGTVVLSLLDPNRVPYFLVLNKSAQGQILAVLSPADFFRSPIERQKGSQGSLFVVNSIGQTIGHSTPEYVGSLMTEDPLVADLMSSENGAGSGLFKSGQETVQGLYERVGGTNLYVVVSTPLAKILANRKSVQWQIILFGVGFALIGGALIYAWSGSSNSNKPLHQVVTSQQSQNSNSAVDRHQVYAQAASGLAQELRGPILSLLGQAHLLRESITDEHVLNELKKIEEGARDMSGTLQKLQSFAGSQDEGFQDLNLPLAIRTCVKSFEPVLKQKGIELSLNLSEQDLWVRTQPQMLDQVVRQVLTNSVEALERHVEKQIFVDLLPANSEGIIELKVRDTGPGLSEDESARVFDPFYTTKTKSDHSGLGLSLALGVLRASGGDIRLTSTLGLGTEVVIVIPQKQKNKVSDEQTLNTNAFVPKVSLPHFELSRAEAPVVADNLNPEAQLPAVLNDRLMQRTFDMIDHLDEIPEPIVTDKLIAPLAPTAKSSDLGIDEAKALPESLTELAPPPPPPSKSAGAKIKSKIDKPSLIAKPKSSRLMTLLGREVSVRRPGEHA